MPIFKSHVCPANAYRYYHVLQTQHRLIYTNIAQWHQWLRYTRPEPPSIPEQQYDLQRQSQLKHLARLADERWASKPSFLDSPKATSQPGPATLPRDPGGYVGQTEPDQNEGVRNAVGSLGEVSELEDPVKEGRKPAKARDNPWHLKGRNPGEGWQPESWTPGASKR